jgi:pyruvate,water dikinase
VAVIIQQFVDTPVSGVLFTTRPDGDDDVFTISAGYGLGEGIVSGSVETDMFLLSKSSGKITADISFKRRKVVTSSNGNGGTRIGSVPQGLAHLSTLPKERLQELQSIGQAVESAFKCPQDIEWGYDEIGELYLMQTRPITTGGKLRNSESTYIWHNANIVESYPGLTLPLTFSFILRNYKVLFRKAASGLVLRQGRLRKRSDIWRNMLGLLHGRVYYNLNSWYGMLSYLPCFSRFQNTWNQAIGITQATTRAQTRLSPIGLLYTVCRIVSLLLTVRRSARRFFYRCDRALAPYRERDFSKAGESEIITCYRLLESDLLDFWHLTLYNDLCAMIYYDLLRRACKRWSRSSQDGLHHELLRNSGNMESVKPLRALTRISRLMESNGRYRTLLALNNAAAWKATRVDAAYAEIRKALDKYVREYGDRCFDELKLESPTYREEPEALMGLIRAHTASLRTGCHSEHCDDVKRSAKASPSESIRDPLKRFVIRMIASQARCAITNRENMRFARTRAYGIVRRMFRQLGRLMEDNGVLAHRDDIFFLTVDEAFGAIHGTGVTTSLTSLVELRKREYARYANHELPARFTTEHYPGFAEHSPEQSSHSAVKKLDGIGCAAGSATGRARVVTDPRTTEDCKDCVLVTRTTDPSWVFLMASARAIIAERGSVLSHTAIVGRELGIPTVVGVEGASSIIPEDATVTVNGSSGRVTWK